MFFHEYFLSCVAGEVGSATSMKLVLNTLYGSMLAGLAETLALGEKVGLQQQQILDILALLPIASPLIASKGEGMFHAIIVIRFDKACKDIHRLAI